MNDTFKRPMPILRASEVVKTYSMGVRDVPVLRGVNLEVPAGGTLSIEGSSGSGKSTLLHLLGGLDVPDSGRVFFEERDMGEAGDSQRTRWRSRHIGFVFQSFHLLSELSVLENVALPGAGSGSGVTRKEAFRRAAVLLDQVGLDHRSAHRPYELSGGEQQRVALARALINKPRVLLADEPTGNLDSKTGDRIMDLLLHLAEHEKTALVIVTHNPTLASRCQVRHALRDGVLTA